MEGEKSRSRAVLIWTVAAGMTLLLFVAMTLLVLFTPPPGGGMATPGRTPAQADGTPPNLVLPSGAEDSTAQPTAGASATAEAANERLDSTAALGLWLSAISAISALLGLASSLWLGWRKEQREAAQHRLDLAKTQLEVEKLRRELRQETPAG